MPIYEYGCEKCGGRVEALLKTTESEPTKHEGCGGRLHKVLSVPARFHGEGGADFAGDCEGGACATDGGLGGCCGGGMCGIN